MMKHYAVLAVILALASSTTKASPTGAAGCIGGSAAPAPGTFVKCAVILHNCHCHWIDAMPHVHLVRVVVLWSMLREMVLITFFEKN